MQSTLPQRPYKMPPATTLPQAALDEESMFRRIQFIFLTEVVKEDIER